MRKNLFKVFSYLLLIIAIVVIFIAMPKQSKLEDSSKVFEKYKRDKNSVSQTIPTGVVWHEPNFELKKEEKH